MRAEYPDFLFVCGAVGSGNTFLFRSLTEDPQVYGLNEGDIGGFLKRLVESEQGIARCPHAPGEFLRFLHALRADRRTLIEKSPSNIRHKALIQAHLPDARFVYMLRAPRAAIVSGLSGRAVRADVEHVARLWRDDTERMLERDEASRVMVYERFLAAPAQALEDMTRGFMPLDAAVVRFATRMARGERADPERWKAKVTPEQARDIEHWVAALDLDALYSEVAQGRGRAARHAAPMLPAWRGRLRRLTAPAFALYYRLIKPLRNGTAGGRRGTSR